MTVETAFYIADLSPTLPSGANPKSEGDNHITLLKSVLQASINGFAGCVLLTGTDVGTFNAYAINPTTALGAYGTNMLVLLVPSATNTGASTINISSLGAKNIKDSSGNALTSGDLVAGQAYLMFYDGTEFNLVTSPTQNYVDQLSFSSALPSQTGNSGNYLTTNGTTASWSNVVTAKEATQAQMEAGSSSQVLVTPAVQNLHPSAAKAWLKCDNSSVFASYNITSVSELGTGYVSVSIATDFSSANFCVVASVIAGGTYFDIFANVDTAGQGVGEIIAHCYDSAGTLRNPAYWYFAMFGDQ